MDVVRVVDAVVVVGSCWVPWDAVGRLFDAIECCDMYLEVIERRCKVQRHCTPPHVKLCIKWSGGLVMMLT